MLSDLGEALNISHISEENGSLKISNDLIQFFTCRKTHSENMKKVRTEEDIKEYVKEGEVMIPAMVGSTFGEEMGTL